MKLSRRHLLRGAGGVALALPALEAMAPRRALAQAPGLGKGGRPQRFIAILVPNGTLPEQYFPTGGETDFRLGPLLKSLEPHRQDLIVTKGLDNVAGTRGPTDGHREGVTAFLTGHGMVGERTTNASSGGPSIDHLIAEHIGKSTKLGSLQIGVEGNAGNIVHISFRGAAQPLPPDGSPTNIFKRLIGDASMSLADLNRMLARRKSVLDRVRGEYAGLATRLGGRDRARLEEHAEAIREVELRLSNEVSCELPTAPAGSIPFEKWPEAVMDLVVLAFRCDLTRVVSLIYRHPGGGGSYFPFLGLGSSYWRCPAEMPNCDPNSGSVRRTDEHHEMSHSPNVYGRELALILDWHYSKLAYLIGRLKAVSDGAASLFDNTLILQGSEAATGPHGKKDMPHLLAGSAGGRLRTGRFVTADRAPHNRLLLSILQAFGVPTPTIGHADLCAAGPLPLA